MRVDLSACRPSPPTTHPHPEVRIVYIRSLLQTKGDGVVSLPPQATVAEAIQLLGARRIGAVVITSDGASVEGILSERDIVVGLGARGGAVLDEPVREHMTTPVRTCGLHATVDEVMATMTNGRFRHVPVVDGGRLVGIVSIGDVVKQRVDELETERRLMHEYLLTGR
jgi:CBS domain-containing protein